MSLKKLGHKIGHKIEKSFRRASHGKFHVSHHDWYANLLRKNLPSLRLRQKFRRLTWGSLKKSHSLGLRHLTGGNNNASSVYVSAGGYQPGGYVYNGRSISEMM